MPGTVNGNARLRVFMTADAVGGVWQYAIDLAAGLSRHGIETTLAVLGPAPSREQQKTAEEAGVTLALTGLPLDWTADTAEEVVEAGRILARMASRMEPDIVHLNSPALAAGAIFPAPVVAVCHSCVATWWRAVRTGPLPEEFAWRRDLVSEGYRRADLLLAPSAAFARATARAYDLGRTPLVVRNGRRALPSGEAGDAPPFAFTAGRLWDDGKNIAVLDRAAERLSVPLRAAGPLRGPNGACIALRHIECLGMLSDTEISQQLAARPIFMSAARYEPFGLAVLEAAQAGCPLVLSDVPTFRELWDGAAVFAPESDADAFAEAVETLVRDPEGRDRLGHLARERAQSYGLDAMCDGVLSAYRTLRGRRVRGEAAA